MSENVIVIENLTKTYRQGQVMVEALRGVSLSIRRGEFIAIMGPSGSGKSTLMNIIGCLDRATNGKYILDDEDVTFLSESSRAVLRNQKIGFVFQNFYLLPRSTAMENVQLPLYYRRSQSAKESARKSLELVGLASRGHHIPAQLSGGERQRVAIARAIVTNPAILFADEPTGNLDSKTGLEIMKIFTDLNKQGVTVILVTHEREIGEYAERIVHIRDGMIQEIETLRQHPVQDGDFISE